MRDNIPKTMPVMPLEVLVIDKNLQDQQLVPALLQDPVYLTIRASNKMVMCSSVVDAVDEKAKAFYEHKLHR